MAASLSDMFPKRKTELEDITNRHKKAKLDSKAYYLPPVQERLPSPSSPSCLLSPKRERQKLVQFELARNQQYENSPLLTPKDDDYASEPEPAPQSLDDNADYVALGSAAALLAHTRRHIGDDLAELARLRAAAQSGSKLALVDFYVQLIFDRRPLPAPVRVVRAPAVAWGKYHPALDRVALHDSTNNNEKGLFKTLNMFGSS